jgi:short subunit dehydrogenase-like uncharacterized protein
VNGGEAVVQACIENDTDYVDVCAEPVHAGRIAQQYGAAAKAKGVLVMQSAGCFNVCWPLTCVRMGGSRCGLTCGRAAGTGRNVRA